MIRKPSESTSKNKQKSDRTFEKSVRGDFYTKFIKTLDYLQVKVYYSL
nr:MAG TPA: hypothetical protein [Bacteriophage sp.]